MTHDSVQTVSLYFKQGPSDKEYHASIDPKDGGYVVHFAYGRRGSTMQTGTKTTTPVDLQTAIGLFNKLVADKKSKGYTEGKAGTPYQHTDKEERVTNIRPQLLNPIEEQDVQRFIKDDLWCAQEKFDGRRRLLQKQGAAIHGINRKGLVVGLPSPVVAEAHGLEGNFTLDGESIGDKLHVFDLLTLNSEDFRQIPYADRVATLRSLFSFRELRHLVLVETAWTRQAKQELLSRLREQNREGIVFKRINAPYVPGQPDSGGSQLKHKFWASLSAIVGTVNTQRSIGIQLLKGRSLVSAGNVTIPPNHPVPAVGQVVEVRYLYAFRESGSVYQPVYLGVREDVTPSECVARQLKFKSDEDES